MKILIAYYSKNGDVEKIAFAIKSELESGNHQVEIEKIKPKKEHSGFVWRAMALFKRSCEIEALKIRDVSSFDGICVGSPNWGRLSLPVKAYIKNIQGLRHKSTFLFSTSFLPAMAERYFPWGYLFDSTFSKSVEKASGRITGEISFSNFFKKSSVGSTYGKKTISDFCHEIGGLHFFSKEKILQQREDGENRLVITGLLLADLLVLVFQVLSSVIGKEIVSWNSLFIFWGLSVFLCILLAILTNGKKTVFLGKYFASVFLMAVWTLAVVYFNPGKGWEIGIGYVFLLLPVYLFRNVRVVVFLGACAILSYGYLFFNYLEIRQTFSPQSDLAFLIAGILIMILVVRGARDNMMRLLDAQEEVEEARAALEVKISARTRELKELADSLEGKVKKRTVELQNKIEELESFNKLAIGRELKMVELKEKIKTLEGELAKYKK